MRGIWGILTLLMRDGEDGNGNDGDEDGEKEASSTTTDKDAGDVVMDQGN